MAVLVLDKRKQPLMPCSEKRARLLLERNRAVVVRVHPFTIRLKDRVGGDTQPVRIKDDPGSRATGLGLVREGVDGYGYGIQSKMAAIKTEEARTKAA